GAMPWLHRHLGTPIMSWLVNSIFGTTIGDVNCGMRGFTQQLSRTWKLRSTGMEFASECLIKAAQSNAKICEVPITLWARENRAPHLRTFRDGFRHMILIAQYAMGRAFRLLFKRPPTKA